MVGLTQEEQKRSSPFTLETILEEEPDVNTNHVNDAIPFDKCIEADKQADEEEKKQRLESDIANYKKWLEESEEELRKLKEEEQD